jgi:hypothetical protein
LAISPGSLNTQRQLLAGAGTQTAGLAFGGYITAETAATEEYDGTSWASNPTGLNTIRRISWLWHTNSCFSIWWKFRSSNCFRSNRRIRWFYLDISNPTLNTARRALAGAWNSNSCFSFWW